MRIANIVHFINLSALNRSRQNWAITFITMRKSLLLLLVSAAVLVGCGKQTVAVPAAPEVQVGVPETGVVTDISARAGQEITATPGDVLYLKLTGLGGTGKQWSSVSPTSSDCLVLKDQHVSNLNEKNASSTFEWWLKVEKTCQVNVQFDYGKLLKKVESSFAVTVSSK